MMRLLKLKTLLISPVVAATATQKSWGAAADELAESIDLNTARNDSDVPSPSGRRDGGERNGGQSYAHGDGRMDGWIGHATPRRSVITGSAASSSSGACGRWWPSAPRREVRTMEELRAGADVMRPSRTSTA